MHSAAQPTRSVALNWAVAYFVAINAADMMTTIIALRHGATEGNPNGQWILHSSGIMGMVVAKVVGTAWCGGFSYWVARRFGALPHVRRGVLICFVAVNLVLTVGVLWNITQW